ncbi:unnamed protein product [Cuscuta epithymum]|uniref:DUF1985 domain-containing protein n=1 Tax=Cuscuta epithymum TaxID=186058 RepID=A0AAV0D6X0_9ASTE|nr:unnamed protein product [Cuscuta epithymum]
MTDVQLGLFRETCFGKLLDFQDLKLQPQLVHCLLLREISHSIPKEIWFDVSGFGLRFSIAEFAVVTGLKCSGEFDTSTIPSSDSNSLIKKYFNSCSKVTREDIETCFLGQKADCDEDTVKIGILYVLGLFFFTSSKDKVISETYLAIVDSGLWDSYDWGKDLFDVTLQNLKGRLFGADDSESDYFFYRILGFPLALQVWFYECCGYCDGVFACRSVSTIPRMLSWHSSIAHTFKKLNMELLSLSASQVFVLLLFSLLLFCFYYDFIPFNLFSFYVFYLSVEAAQC